MRARWIFLLAIILLVSCTSLRYGEESIKRDYGLARDPQMQYRTIRLTYKEVPWFRASNPSKYWPERQDELVIQGEFDFSLEPIPILNSKIRMQSWTGFIRIGSNEIPVKIKFFKIYYPNEETTSFSGLKLISDNYYKISFDDHLDDGPPNTGAFMPIRIISMDDGNGRKYEGRMVLLPKWSPSSQYGNEPDSRYYGADIFRHPLQKIQFTDDDGVLLGESQSGVLYLREDLSDEQADSIIMMAALSEIIKIIVD